MQISFFIRKRCADAALLCELRSLAAPNDNDNERQAHKLFVLFLRYGTITHVLPKQLRLCEYF